MLVSEKKPLFMPTPMGPFPVSGGGHDTETNTVQPFPESVSVVTRGRSVGLDAHLGTHNVSRLGHQYLIFNKCSGIATPLPFLEWLFNDLYNDLDKVSQCPVHKMEWPTTC